MVHIAFYYIFGPGVVCAVGCWRRASGELSRQGICKLRHPWVTQCWHCGCISCRSCPSVRNAMKGPCGGLAGLASLFLGIWPALGFVWMAAVASGVFVYVQYSCSICKTGEYERR